MREYEYISDTEYDTDLHIHININKYCIITNYK